MARSRNIKPGFFTNELLAELPAFDRLLFVGLWCLADREGRLEDRPKRIKIELFPCDSYDVSEGIESLCAAGFVERYQVDEFSVIEIVNFTKHQSPHGSEKDSALPDRNGYLTVNERRKNVVVPYKSTKVHIKESLPNVKPPLDVVEPNVSERPDSLIPDSLIPDSYKDQEHLPPVDEKPEKEERSKTLRLADLINLGVNEQHAKDWLAVRKQKRLAPTQTALSAVIREASKVGLTLAQAIQCAAEEGWAGFKADWFNKKQLEGGGNHDRQDTRRSAGPVSLVDQVRERNRQREQERAGQAGADDSFRTFDGEIVGADDEHVRPQMDLRTWP